MGEEREPGKEGGMGGSSSGLLSELAKELLSGIPLQDMVGPEGGEWQDCFTGNMATEWIASACNVTPQSAAFIAQALLDAHVFFPKVPVDPVFQDNPAAVYSIWDHAALSSAAPSLPSGVITELTPCYSPSCSSGRPCYSPTCPRASWRVYAEQESNFLQPTFEKRKTGSTFERKDNLWSNSVDKALLEQTPQKEIKRQEIIFEIIYTEQDYLQDLKILKKVFKEPVEGGMFQIEEQAKFVERVFGQLERLIDVNERFLEALKARQDADVFVPYIGDVFLAHVDTFKVYLEHCPYQKQAIQESEKQRRINGEFRAYAEERERSLVCRRLPLTSFLGRPRGRLIKYRLILETLLKATPPDNRDTDVIPQALEQLKEILGELDRRTGQEENRLNLAMIEDMLVWKEREDPPDLSLSDPARLLLFSGALAKRDTDAGELQVFLFDHLLLLAKKGKRTKDIWDYSLVVYKEPLPLNQIMLLEEDADIEAFLSSQSEALKGEGRVSSTLSRTLFRRQRGNTLTPRTSNVPPAMMTSPTFFSLQDVSLGATSSGFALGVLGRGSKIHFLRARSPAEKQEWIDRILEAQRRFEEKSHVASLLPLGPPFLPSLVGEHIYCGEEVSGGLLLGSDNGVFLLPSNHQHQGAPVCILKTERVLQLRHVATHGFVVILHGKNQSLGSFSFRFVQSQTQVPKEELMEVDESSGTTLFKVGQAVERELLGFIRSKSDSVSRSVKLVELDAKKQTKKFKKFLLPSPCHSLRFLSRAIVLATDMGGFQFIDIDSSASQDVLDPQDASLKSLQIDTLKPKILLPIGENFLVCYREKAFYINKQGSRVNPHILINWIGFPSSFAPFNEYVVAFNDKFIEIWRLSDGVLVQVITGHHFSHLSENDDVKVRPILVDLTTKTGSHQIFKIALRGT